MKTALLALLSFCTLYLPAQSNTGDKKTWLVDIIFRMENDVEKTTDDIRKLRDDIDKCNASIVRAENLAGMAETQHNADAAKVASQAKKKANDALFKNISSLDNAENHLKRAKDVLAAIKRDSKNAESRYEQYKMNDNIDAWLLEKNEAVRKRMVEPCVTCDYASRSLTSTPPPLPADALDNLKIGDVLLLDAEGGSHFINWGDKLLSWDLSSAASHTLIYIKEVNGKKLFLNNTPGHGAEIISEDQFKELYNGRPVNVARLKAEPLSDSNYNVLFKKSVELAQRQNKDKPFLRMLNYKFGTTYGVAGNDMVCSDACRWALVNAGADIPETDDRIKKMLGIHFSPVDFAKSDKFIVTPLNELSNEK